MKAFCNWPLSPVFQGLTVTTLLSRKQKNPKAESKTMNDPPTTPAQIISTRCFCLELLLVIWFVFGVETKVEDGTSSVSRGWDDAETGDSAGDLTFEVGPSTKMGGEGEGEGEGECEGEGEWDSGSSEGDGEMEYPGGRDIEDDNDWDRDGDIEIADDGAWNGEEDDDSEIGIFRLSSLLLDDVGASTRCWSNLL